MTVRFRTTNSRPCRATTRPTEPFTKAGPPPWARPQQCFLLGVNPALTARDWLGHGRIQGLLAPRVARAQHVEADPRDHRRQPSAQVLDAARVGAAEVEPGLLYGVVRLGERAEHPVGHRPQAGAVGLELLRQPFVFVHQFYSFILFSHNSDERDATSSIGHILSSRSVIVVTRETHPM